MTRPPSDPLLHCVLPGTPVGPLTLVISSRGLREIRFGQQAHGVPDGVPNAVPTPDPEPAADAVGAAARTHLEAARTRLTWMLTPIPSSATDRLTPAPSIPALDLVGTPFQTRVWAALLQIPRGELRSYGDLAEELGCGSPRAVGQAVGANPLPILVPCHRVVTSDGRLGGYSGGLDRKVRLLDIEGFQPPVPRFEARLHLGDLAAPEAR